MSRKNPAARLLEVRYGLGFTLIELMIVVAIIAILAAVAYPSYRQYVLESHRVEAKTMLLDAAARQERFYSTISPNSYADSMSALGYASNSPLTENGYYKVTITATPPGCNPDTATLCTGYSLSAAPQDAQTDDDCGTLTLNGRGQRGDDASGAADCW